MAIARGRRAVVEEWRMLPPAGRREQSASHSSWGGGQRHRCCAPTMVWSSAGAAMLSWAHARGVTLRLIETKNPTQNAYIASLNGRPGSDDSAAPSRE